MDRALLFASAAIAGFILPHTGCAATDDDVRLNQIQVIGTHNSYHAGLTDEMAAYLAHEAPTMARSLAYRHPDLATQLSGGVRQIELDVFADTRGGRFARPKGPALLAAAGSALPSDPYPDGRMLRPGFKVMHMQDVDMISNCQPFVACLDMVRAWSRAHPGHIPIFILIETKEHQDYHPSGWALTEAEPFTAASFDALDAEIRSVFAPDEMIVPDQVRGHYQTLDAAVRAGNWPTLAEARGKVIFLMDQRSAGPLYLAGHPSLAGRVIFTNTEPGQPDAAFTELNDGPPEAIRSLVEQNYLVRTQTDADLVEAQRNDTRRRDAAMASGAQILSTDYPRAEPSAITFYNVAFPDDLPARCNPVVRASPCRDRLLEP